MLCIHPCMGFTLQPLLIGFTTLAIRGQGEGRAQGVEEELQQGSELRGIKVAKEVEDCSTSTPGGSFSTQPPTSLP